mmetsp:Transcript_8336/g.17352  ORF Transcript_8336/g.17352 Transcript_8336/m.17352 type:complete len:204 (-) Transcript_8336:828-1439(-)
MGMSLRWSWWGEVRDGEVVRSDGERTISQLDSSYDEPSLDSDAIGSSDAESFEGQRASAKSVGQTSISRLVKDVRELWEFQLRELLLVCWRHLSRPPRLVAGHERAHGGLSMSVGSMGISGRVLWIKSDGSTQMSWKIFLQRNLMGSFFGAPRLPLSLTAFLSFLFVSPWCSRFISYELATVNSGRLPKNLLTNRFMLRPVGG